MSEKTVLKTFVVPQAEVEAAMQAWLDGNKRILLRSARGKDLVEFSSGIQLINGRPWLAVIMTAQCYLRDEDV